MEFLSRHFDMAIETEHGIKRLRELILSLAMRGKLVPQDPNDQPASELLKEIEAQKEKLVKEGKIKKQENKPPMKTINADEMPYELPRGWVWVRFGTITINRDGERIPISRDKRSNLRGIYDYYGASGIIDHVNDFLFNKDLLLIGEDGANLINRSTPIAFIASGKYWVNNHAHVIDAISKDLLVFLEKQINSINLEPYVTGTAQPKMNQAKMNSIPIALPPLAEQHRIVAKIDSLMVLCDRLEAERNERNNKRLAMHRAAVNKLLSAEDSETFNSSWSFIARNFDTLHSVPQNVAELKKAILQLAVMGKLVPQDPHDEPATALLAQIAAAKAKLVKEGRLKKIDSLPPIKPEEVPYELSKGWVWVRLGEILIWGPKNGISPRPVAYETPFKTLTLTATTSGYFKPEYFKYIQNEVELYSELWLKKNDILIQRGNSLDYVGIAAIYDGPENEFIYPDLMIKIRLSNSVDIQFIHKMLIGPYGRKYFQENASGTSGSMPKINHSSLLALPIPLPPLAEQKRIVAKLDRLMSLCDALEQQIEDSTGKQAAILNAVLARIVA